MFFNRKNATGGRDQARGSQPMVRVPLQPCYLCILSCKFKKTFLVFNIGCLDDKSWIFARSRKIHHLGPSQGPRGPFAVMSQISHLLVDFIKFMVVCRVFRVGKLYGNTFRTIRSQNHVILSHQVGTEVTESSYFQDLNVWLSSKTIKFKILI